MQLYGLLATEVGHQSESDRSLEGIWRQGIDSREFTSQPLNPVAHYTVLLLEHVPLESCISSTNICLVEFSGCKKNRENMFFVWVWDSQRQDMLGE